jgi:hypothetical protein
MRIKPGIEGTDFQTSIRKLGKPIKKQSGRLPEITGESNVA